ncbi:MAG: methyltransferase domain-containing protein [Sulfuritalea sp.]|nr:methyltransferase domain-containing protein [Sulfuritalea sp.]
MIPGIVEYVSLRVARRFLFSDAFLLRWGRYLPYYRTNANQADPKPVCDLYTEAMKALGLEVSSERTILEVGSGATDAVGVALLERGLAGEQGRVLLYEPYVTPIPVPEPAGEAGLRCRIDRLTSLRQIARGSVDLVVSHSVLEHVRDPQSLMLELGRILAPNGWMIHAVDYRDHFFKYPYHFLFFSRRIWERWLDPGDLPRWRLSDHRRLFAGRGFRMQVLRSATLAEEFRCVVKHLAPEFDANDPDIAVTTAILALERTHLPSQEQVGSLFSAKAYEFETTADQSEQEMQRKDA